MDPAIWQDSIRSAAPAIIGIMAACLLIIVVGAVARAVSQAMGGGSGSDDD